MQFAKSKLEMIYKYAAMAKEDTVKAMEVALPAIKDKLTYLLIIRNVAENLEKLPEPECSRFIVENKTHHIEKGESTTVYLPCVHQSIIPAIFVRNRHKGTWKV